MLLLREILSELFKMFLADLRLSAGVVGVVLLAWIAAGPLALPPLAAGGILLAGCLALLVAAVLAAARR